MSLFRTVPESEPVKESAEIPHFSVTDPVLLSILALDLGGIPQGGWADFLARRGMAFGPDSLGRDSVSHAHAKQLLDEARELVLRQRAAARVQEALAVEESAAALEQISKGIPWYEIPHDTSPSAQCWRLRRLTSRAAVAFWMIFMGVRCLMRFRRCLGRPLSWRRHDG